MGQGTAAIRTLADLARLAGVSTGTVSRALSNKTTVNPVTGDRIRALAAAYAFHPNQMASRLRKGCTGVVGVVVPLGHEHSQRLSDPFFMALLGHLADELTARGYEVMLSRVIPDSDDWLDRIVGSGMLDGVLLVGQSDQFDTIERVAAQYRPLVAWGEHRPGQRHCAIGVDNRSGGRLAGEALIRRGRRNLAFLGECRTPELAARYAGLCDAAASAGLALPLQLDTHLATAAMSSQIAAHLDHLSHAIDGVAAASDVIAMQLLRLLADRNIAVPDTVSVTGFDDLPLSEQTVPRLTTIRQDIVRGASLMVATLIARMSGHDEPTDRLIPLLIERDSA
ncbi:LacI family DNA-binding transcriptional regulator [Sphingomonas sp. 2R-10]|uniref:LacI family DNA-binding transcriptional regulator n=1 Tax=Sphingomonas sp. 2R-10 TaxID=3045148 RepID=UPI000F778C40|nr:LacI family DNA-binding transcriptional regulator [Sphingomonas sp. 2R-10]MDJ0277150.1 LacI family DNA-binding transcriptional regulator [Sphingomonas sp. 2R-10]